MLPTTLRTERLLLRSQRPEDAPLVKAAVDASLAHLKASVAWARHEPSPLADYTARLARSAAAFHAGEQWSYSIFDPAASRVLGGVAAERVEPALASLVGADALELGYWLRADATGRGHAAEATLALAKAVFAHLGAPRVAICHDPANQASGSVPRRLGFHCLGTVPDAVLPDRQAADGGIRTASMVWTLDAEALRRAEESRLAPQIS